MGITIASTCMLSLMCAVNSLVHPKRDAEDSSDQSVNHLSFREVKRLDGDLAKFEAELREKGRLGQTDDSDDDDEEEEEKNEMKQIEIPTTLGNIAETPYWDNTLWRGYPLGRRLFTMIQDSCSVTIHWTGPDRNDGFARFVITGDDQDQMERAESAVIRVSRAFASCIAKNGCDGKCVTSLIGKWQEGFCTLIENGLNNWPRQNWTYKMDEFEVDNH